MKMDCAELLSFRLRFSSSHNMKKNVPKINLLLCNNMFFLKKNHESMIIVQDSI